MHLSGSQRTKADYAKQRHRRSRARRRRRRRTQDGGHANPNQFIATYYLVYTPVQQSVMLNVSDIYCNQLGRFPHLLTTERSKKAPSYLIPTTSRPLVSLVESRPFTHINLLGNSTCDTWDVRVRAHLQTLPPCSLLGNHCDHAKRFHGARTSSIPSQSGLSLSPLTSIQCQNTSSPFWQTFLRNCIPYSLSLLTDPIFPTSNCP